ncbi:MAG TPA: SpoIIE family protein phosphatase [Terracidiphilus sp.]|nr:SpoIIE family protein phosphatase [Terracidiphilus sp.]
MFSSKLRSVLRLSTISLIVLGSFWLLEPGLLGAQTFDASELRQPKDLSMNWLVKAGDDPAYAQPNLDDSKWTVVDPSETLLKTYQVRPEVVWYRLHVKVAPNQSGLALKESNLSSAFEIYVNGRKLIQSGSVAPYKPYTIDGSLIKRIPETDIDSGMFVIAIRVHISQAEWVSGFPGFYFYNLTIGQEHALYDETWLSIIGAGVLDWFGRITGFGLGIVALALFAAQRGQREYLWLFLMFLVHVLVLPLVFYRYFHNIAEGWLWLSSLLWIAFITFVTLTMFALLRVRFGRWIQIVLGIVIASQLVSDAMTVSQTGSVLANVLTQMPVNLLFAGVIPVLAIVSMRRGNREAGILLIPFLINALTIYLNLAFYIATTIPSMAKPALALQTEIFNPTVGPFTLDLNAVAGCLFVLSLAVIIVVRSTRMSRQQAFIENEMAAAREVQQIILPEAIERVPGFQIESAYAPAQEVGGDFFQIVPAPEGSLLVVIGDVAGKGLPAAMLVSVLVGAIRAVAEYTQDPAELLANLNKRLVGRVSGGFSTALAARIFADGTMVMSNAGHLAPYLDGHELAVPGALPLGAMAGTHYETVRAQLARGSRLTFYSDGVVEATNPKGELLGFDRSELLSLEPVQKIVDAAQKFGQHDDITVIAITREAAPAREAAQASRIPVVAPAMGD